MLESELSPDARAVLGEIRRDTKVLGYVIRARLSMDCKAFEQAIEELMAANMIEPAPVPVVSKAAMN
jgi:hypothetical protein